MNTQRNSYGLEHETDIVPKLEGMEVEFDEKVTLFPVELEEVREVAKRSSSATRNSRTVR